MTILRPLIARFLLSCLLFTTACLPAGGGVRLPA